jgi:hypothetical protein
MTWETSWLLDRGSKQPQFHKSSAPGKSRLWILPATLRDEEISCITGEGQNPRSPACIHEMKGRAPAWGTK